jgi:hypothetical protein
MMRDYGGCAEPEGHSVEVVSQRRPEGTEEIHE